MLALSQQFLNKLEQLGVKQTPHVLVVSISEQKMRLYEEGNLTREFPVSTALNGSGQKINTSQTPLGLHRIQQKIGKQLPLGAMFNSREFEGKIWPADSKSTGDLITSRILWLEGLEPGFNSGKDAEGNVVDSHVRYIYIHGTNHEDQIGQAVSRGCIRMLNADVVSLFDIVKEGDLVWIQE